MATKADRLPGRAPDVLRKASASDPRPTTPGPTATGASTKELMARMGHANSAAALRYQHATADRDQVIALALSELARPAEVVPMAQDGHDARDRRAMTRSQTRSRSPRKGS
jgi:hypothetical protein